MPSDPDLRSPAADYRALREGAALLDLEGWTAIELHGADTRDFLQGMATQDLASAAPDTAVETLFLSEKGRPVALAWVRIESSGAEATIVADGAGAAALRPHLERFRIMEDVEFAPPSGGAARYGRIVGAAGPSRATLLAALASEIRGSRAIPALGPISFLLRPTGGDPSGAAPPDLSGTVAPEAAEAWRIAQGLPLAGQDFDLERIATELDLPDAISFTKGCYVGQEVVARTSNRGQVRRRRVGFRFAWSADPSYSRGTPLVSEGGSAGFLTSAAMEPGTREGLGMGFVATERLEASEPHIHIGTMDGPAIRIMPWPL